MNWGAVLGAGIKGVGAAVESRDDRTRELLIESERQRKAQREDSVLNARVKREEQDAAYDAQDRVVKEAERSKKEIAEAAETTRRNALIPSRVRFLRDNVPDFKDPAKFDDITVQGIAADDAEFKFYVDRAKKPGTAPVRGTPEYLSMLREEATTREQVGAQFRAPREPRVDNSARDAANDATKFMRDRIAFHMGTNHASAVEAQQLAEGEYKAAEQASSRVRGQPTAVTRPTAGTKASPQTLKQASDAEMDAALKQAGDDPTKAAAILRKKGLR